MNVWGLAEDFGQPTDCARSGDTIGSESLGVTEQFSTFSINGGGESSVDTQSAEKDPRKIARKYQMELCEIALKENIIVCLGTGCGKTHIAVLLIYEMGHLIKKPQKNICVFLAHTVALVQQQAKVIQDSIDFKVGTYCGSYKHLKGHREWEKEIEQHEIFVMTPEILLHNLSHCFMRIDLISLLIFDECHYAQSQSNHPYAEIMKVFYRVDAPKLPRIFGMTASPKIGKGGSINSLESLLHAKVYSVEDKEELEQFVASPKVNIYYYSPIFNNSSSPLMVYAQQLEVIKHQCISILSGKTDDHSSLMNAKKMLRRLHDNVIFCLESLGLYGALKASYILLRGDDFERSELAEVEGNFDDDSVYDVYLNQAASKLKDACGKDSMEADLSSVDVLKEPFFSRKLLLLVQILSSFRLQESMKCIVFVNRIVTARSLSYILRKIELLSAWKCGYLVGVHSGLKNMSRKNTNAILDKFRFGELNLLVATKVGEEGLDIQTCCLVIRFDLPETVASFIQSRGRARMPQSEYAFLVDSGNHKELNLIEHFKKDEEKMNQEIASRKPIPTSGDFKEPTYKVDCTGATINFGSSISLLHHYCSKLPHDDYFNPKPEFFYSDDPDGTVCHIVLPSNAPVHEVVSEPQSSMKAAKKDACLKACKMLHVLGALNDYLLPDQDEGNDYSVENYADSDSCDDEDSRGEIHNLLIPTVLKEPWARSEDPVCLNSYFLRFSPFPVDRDYKEFGLFVKAALPREAEKMKLELCLARGRIVMTELVPIGVVDFQKDEILLAERFQKMFLKVIIDRNEFIPEFVSLEKNDSTNFSSSTFYLLLPVTPNEYEDTIVVDWKLVRRCLSSHIFSTQDDTRNDGISDLTNHLELANGSKSINDVVNSLVYAPCKEKFFFVSDIVRGKNAYSLYKDSKNHVMHYLDGFGIQLLYPEQPLLKAKQLFCLNNLLRKKGSSESHQKEEHFIELPPEICQLKIIGFSKDIGSSLSLLPSLMHRLESLLVAIELKQTLSAAFPEGAEVTAHRVLEALTTEKCNECISLERLEVLGDAFLKFAVGRQLFLLYDTLDEGQLTRKRSKLVNNSNLSKLATRSNLQVYIRDQSFDPDQFFPLGRPCPVICCKEIEKSIHFPNKNRAGNGVNVKLKCNKGHHWLHKKTVADVVEALVGAFLVDSGFKAATTFLKWIGIRVDFKPSEVRNMCAASSTFMPLAGQIDITALEKCLGYCFVHKGLLVQAFIHPSYNNHWGGCYQRLEFLGDAVLDYLITSYLYSVYPELNPGQLTDLRSESVNNNSLADIAVRRSIHKHIICGSSSLTEAINIYASFTETSSSKKVLDEGPPCPKALGDLVESSVGAILLDSGFDLNLTWKTMISFLDHIATFSNLRLNPIRELRELCQSYSWDVQFPKSKDGGQFLVEGKVNGDNVSQTATASSYNKKAAERMAAQQLLAKLKTLGHKAKSKSLEEVLRTTCKKEAKLIGYDETPTPVNGIASIAPKFEDLKLTPFRSEKNKFDLNIHSVSRDSRIIWNSSAKTRRKDISEYDSCYSKSLNPGSISKKSAKSLLHEICAANSWNLPLYECWRETGPAHLKNYTFRVMVKIEDVGDTVLECHGEASAKKKDAKEHAAEGALWYLKRQGYIHEKDF